MKTTRNKLVAQARTWLGTDFKHQGRIKKTPQSKGGVDCLGLVIGIARELNLESGVLNMDGKDIPLYKFDDLEYSRNSDPQKLLNGFSKACIEIDLKKVKAGDVLLFKFEGMPKHLAIITEVNGNQITIIHAFLKTGRVVEHLIDDEWKSRIAKVYILRKIK